MNPFCDNALCENPGFKEVPVSVRRAGDEKRTLCAACEEAYSWGVQHGTFVAEAEGSRLDLDGRELATVLAALRYYQAENLQGGADVADEAVATVATDGGRLQPLTRDEIDALCERLNSQAVRRATPRGLQVILAVSGGVAEVLRKPRGVAVTLYDYDVEDGGGGLSRDPVGKTCRLFQWQADEEVTGS